MIVDAAPPHLQGDLQMSRVQLALNVADLDASIDFYTKLFDTPPTKVRDGYANFAITDPPLKLVLFAGDGQPGSLNHIGVEVETVDAVTAAVARAEGGHLAADVQENISCCYAVQDKVWIHGPDNSWEFYTVHDDAPNLLPEGECCVPANPNVEAATSCCG
jgi:catechol 2,3-dioxygenase-like lactoylglutathione lyase family enzyme